MSAKTSPAGTVSLVLAITGHRDLPPEDIPGFETEIVKIFLKLRQDYPKSPLLLLSGLAEGGDRAGVRAAIVAAVPYIAVLPKPVDLYRNDFKSEASGAEFEKLRKGAARCIELALDPASTPEDISHPGPARDKQYERLGRFMVQYSQMLIAIWDGNRAEKQGGTSQIVAMKLREKGSLGLFSFAREYQRSRPVYVLPARRIYSGHDSVPALKCEIRCPEPSTFEDYEASYRLMNRFNSDVANASGNFTQATKNSGDHLFEGVEAIGLSDAMKWVATVYSRADALAILFAAASLRLWKAPSFYLGFQTWPWPECMGWAGARSLWGSTTGAWAGLS
jgi:hypothetical protein